jgi:hypothetical protein
VRRAPPAWSSAAFSRSWRHFVGASRCIRPARRSRRACAWREPVPRHTPPRSSAGRGSTGRSSGSHARSVCRDGWPTCSASPSGSWTPMGVGQSRRARPRPPRRRHRRAAVRSRDGGSQRPLRGRRGVAHLRAASGRGRRAAIQSLQQRWRAEAGGLAQRHATVRVSAVAGRLATRAPGRGSLDERVWWHIEGVGDTEQQIRLTLVVVGRRRRQMSAGSTSTARQVALGHPRSASGCGTARENRRWVSPMSCA